MFHPVPQGPHPTRGWLSFDSEVLHDPERDHWVMLYTLRDTPCGQENCSSASPGSE